MLPRRDRLSPLILTGVLPRLLITIGCVQIAIALILFGWGGNDALTIGHWILGTLGSMGVSLILIRPKLQRDRRALDAFIAERTAELTAANAQLAAEIEDRKQAEIILRQRETTLEKVQQLAHIGDWEVEFATQTITWSEEMYRIHGRDPSLPSPAPEESFHYIHPDDREIHQTQIVAKVYVSQPFATDIRIVRPDGDVRYLEARGEPIFDENGQMVRYLGMSRDLTDRKAAEEKLRKSEALLREAQVAASLGCWEHDMLTNQTLWTEGLYRIHQRDPQSKPPTPEEFFSIIYPDDVPLYQHQMIESIGSTQPFTHDFRIIRQDGEVRWITVKGEPILNPQGEVIRYVGIVMDISDRKAAEERLRQSEATNRALIQAIPDLLIRIQREGKCVDIRYGSNVRAFNLDKAQVDKNIQDVLPFEQAAAMLQTIEDVLQTQTIRVEERQVEFNRTTYYEEIRIAPCGNDEVLVIIRDVTDRKQTELELQKAKETAEAANRAKSMFLSSMSHELRTPLNAILGFAQLLNRDSEPTPKQQKYIDTINRNGQHLLELINDVLEVSKIESGKVTLHPVEVDLYQLLNNLHNVFQQKAIAKNLSLSFERSPTVPQFIYTDESKLRQILTNLLSNAIKFTGTGFVQLRVQPHPGTPAPPYPLTLHFAVQDTGLGIAFEEQAQLFKSFSQTTTGQQASEGTGLGLVISRGFVELMQGDIGVNSTPGVGSTFWFTLPVQVLQGDRREKSLPNRKVIGLQPDQPRYRILVIEDNAENAQFLLRLLSLVGFEVQHADNGQSGLNVWTTWAPHLILMDMQLPVMDGYETTRQIRVLERHSPRMASPPHLVPLNAQVAAPAPALSSPLTKIIAVTGSAFEEDRTQILASGCNDFIRKPFQENLLLERLTYHLGVQYRYEEAESELLTGQKAPSILSQAALSVMPDDWIQRLDAAAKECSQDKVLQLLTQIPQNHAALALELEQLTNNFRFEDIVVLTDAE
jgi:signal transduction histidine kinase/CheY-like chemotaxis protein